MIILSVLCAADEELKRKRKEKNLLGCHCRKPRGTIAILKNCSIVRECVCVFPPPPHIVVVFIYFAACNKTLERSIVEVVIYYVCAV